ncbi:acetate--CoA ligase family protein [Neobacillus kokaensis]|uniref:acetate--CoA ligase family protein n=1 Tax=Neobacillus kokaensis TaxID=2759023 RepID=UPI001CB9B976|nr:acetate--CoA ligase family protein [Neobacillus kokaensis]
MEEEIIKEVINMKKKLNLEPMFSPKSITIIGASAGVGKISARPLFLLRKLGYQGTIYPVNAKYTEIEGYPCIQEIEELPKDIDLAIISIRASEVLPTLERLAKRSVKSAVVFSSGFSEAGESGEELQQRLNKFVEETGIPVCGPNSLGFFNLKESVIASFLQLEPSRMDPIAFITQSGAFGTLSYKMLNDMGTGYQYFVSSGNEATVDFFDYVQYFAKQEDIKVIGGYIEGARDLEKMNEAIRLCQHQDKPLILMKVGKSEKGAEAAISHTASLTGDASIYSGFFKQKNVIQVDDEEELIDTVNLFNKAKTSSQRGGVALVTISGGAGIVMADKCEQYGIELAELMPETTSKLKELLPAFASVKNPIDVTAQIMQDLEKLFESIRVTLEDDGVEALVVYNQLGDFLAPKIIPGLSEIAQQTNKTFVVCWAGASEQTKDALFAGGVCWLPTPSRSIRALKNLLHYKRRKGLLPKQDFTVTERLTNRIVMEAFEGITNEYTSKQHLKNYGISVPAGSIVKNVESAVKVAEEIGYPIVLKVLSRQIVHKSDAGVVKVNLKSEDEVRNSFEEILINAGKYNPQVQIEGVVVEKMMKEGLEMMIGSIQDPLFGPCILLGSGGVFVEVLNDTVIRPAPLTMEDAWEMIRSLKGYAVLKGIRGQGPYDIQALAETLVKVSEFCLDQQDWLQELDINPVLVQAAKKGVTALDCLLVGKRTAKHLSYL